MAVSAAILAHAPAAFLSLKSPLNRNRPRDKNRTKNAEKPPFQAVFLRKMVRVTGFEPAASCSQSRRATNCATPGYEVVGWPGRILPKNQRLFSQTRATQVSIPERRSENNPSRNFFASNEFADVIIQRRDLPAAIHIIILHIGYPSPQDHRHSLRHGPPLKLPSPWPWPPKLPQHSHLREHLPQTGHKCCPHRPLYAPDG